MRSCWKFEPIERPDFAELVKKIDNLKDKPQRNKPLLRKQTTAYLPVIAQLQ